jgi:hypothetical protein
MLLSLAYLKKVIITISYLRPTQIIYQLFNLFHKPKSLKHYSLKLIDTIDLAFRISTSSHESITHHDDEYRCNFINRSHLFKEKIDWKITSYGKLWNYNLQYATFLHQKNLSQNSKTELLSDLYQQLWNGNLPIEPYPASLRIMSVIRFLSTNEIQGNKKERISIYLAAEINYLSKHLEFHLLGNHLLENGFALLMGGYFFNNIKWIHKAEHLLIRELNEQILQDGAHFELSPMYHNIILFRALEAYGYLPAESRLKILMKEKAEYMLGWMNAMAFSDGTCPHFNDSTNDISLSKKELEEISETLNLLPKEIKLSSSGYRKFELEEMKLRMDVHGISPSYQPGHSHADTFTFCLNFNNTPIIVDAGISTYEISDRRSWERSTNAHNTLELNGENSSDVWASFRVASRARVKILKDDEHEIYACHDGYRRLKANVYRKLFLKNNKIHVEDAVESKRKIEYPIIGRLHLDANVSIRRENYKFILNECICIEFENDVELSVEKYELAKGFNFLISSSRICYKLHGNSTSFTIYKI